MLVIANWKAYVEDLDRAKRLFATARRLAKLRGMEIVLAPPAPLLGHLAKGSRGLVAFAAQDLSLETGGAHTGENTAHAYAAAGVRYAIVGHSERRARGDTDEIVAQKVAHAVAANLTPILCVGERERDPDGKYLSGIREELTAGLQLLEPKARGRVIVAYEPLWAINKTAEDAISAPDLSEMVGYIRKVFAELLPGKNAARTTVLYGGSVESENIRGLAGGGDVDGFLIGHASVDPESFAALVKALA